MSGCGGDDDSDGGLKVAATTGVLEDITRNVAGDDVTVEQIVPAGSSPHDFQLSAMDRAEIEDADLVVENGAALEAGLPLDEVDAPRFVLVDHVGRLRPEDPHVWMDPTRVVRALPQLADALAEVDPEHAEGYRRRASAYANELRELDAEIRQFLAGIPAADRELVTSHDALGYFADRYRFEVVATPFPASGPEAEPNAAAIEEVEEAIRKAGVPTVFAQEDDDPEVLEMIADSAGVEVVTDLLVESPSIAGGYIDMLRRDASLIRDGLAG